MVYISGRVLQSACAMIPSCSNPTSNGQISVFSVIPELVMLTHTVLEWIYNRVAITHLLHRLSQKRTYYNKYGLRPSK